jgi:peroxiredoxin
MRLNILKENLYYFVINVEKKPSKIKEGDKAPLFKIDSYNANTIDLANLFGEQKIVLIFSRYFGCPICQLDLKDLMNRKSEIEQKGAKILYITQSGEKVAKEYIDNEKIDFPVIPSTKDELYADYGLGLKQGPGQFVIDEQGNILHAKKGWLDIDALLEVL